MLPKTFNLQFCEIPFGCPFTICGERIEGGVPKCYEIDGEFVVQIDREDLYGWAGFDPRIHQGRHPFYVGNGTHIFEPVTATDAIEFIMVYRK